MARRFGAFSLAGAAVLLFHTAAFAQQSAPAKDKPADKATDKATKVKAAKETAAKDAPLKDEADKGATDKEVSKDAKEVAKEAPAPEAGANQEATKAPQDLPPGYGPPPGYRNPTPNGYPQPPAEEPYYQGPYQQGPYQHDYYYGPPTPPYGYYPPPRYYRRYAPPPPARYYEPASYRQFFFGFGLGVGGVSDYAHDLDSTQSRVGIGYNLRLGFGVSPRWALVLSADGASAYFQNMNLSETVFTVGPQFWVTPKLYVRGGIGAATRTYEYDSYYSDYYGDYYGDYYSESWTDSGMGAVAAIGFEFVQSYHVSLAVEANGTVGYYNNKDTLSTFGINFVMNLF
jgi:hypothetical protein